MFQTTNQHQLPCRSSLGATSSAWWRPQLHAELLQDKSSSDPFVGDAEAEDPPAKWRKNLFNDMLKYNQT